MKRLGKRFRDLRLFPKLLLPFLLLIVVIGLSGAFFTVRYLSSRAQGELDRNLFQRSVDAQIHLRDRALYLLESVRFGANIEGVPEAVAARDARQTARLLTSVLAVRTELDLLVATDGTGQGLVQIRIEDGDLRALDAELWNGYPFVKEVLRGVVDRSGDKRVGFLRLGDTDMVAVAGPVRTRKLEGAVIAAITAEKVAAEAAKRVRAGIAIYDGNGDLLGSAGIGRPVGTPPALVGGRPVRITQTVDGGDEMATLYSPLELRDERAGTLAVTVPAAPAFASVRGAGLRLALILLFAMAAVVGLGALLSRSILKQVKPLVQTNRALGRGDLSARTPVLGDDELGELARGFNLMAEELQASYAELEMRVAARTEELQRLYQEVLRTAEARTAFFAAVSHEFRTPLFAIIGNSELLLDARPSARDDGWKEFGVSIKQSGEHLLALVNEILDLAKFESGRMEVDLVDVSLGDVVRELSGTIVPLARKSDLKVAIDIPKRLPLVRADSTRLKQIILNLASNAIKYTPAGGSVGMTASESDGMIRVSMSDTGVGIPADVSPETLFEPFYQVKGTKAQKGQASTGLGLALTKRLVEAHGGTIWYEGRAGGGTTFHFTLHAADSGQIANNRTVAVSA